MTRDPQQHDVVIIGAGISGIGAACRLQAECPEKRCVILERRAAIGGTWDLFRFPGIRSDSDLYTYGYDFKPWHGQAIATGPEILRYLGEVVREHAIAARIRFRHHAVAASWSTADACWTVHAETPDGTVAVRGRFLFLCQGYFDYDAGHRPDFPEQEAFGGSIVHPQHWPENLDYRGKRMAVIGSGATAATIVPAVAADAAHVVQLQRSPTYYLPLDGAAEDATIQDLRALDVPKEWIHGVKKRKALEFSRVLAERALADPQAVAKDLIGMAAASLPEGYDVQTHFTPRYAPWRQRLCLLPKGDLFAAIRSGKASVETGTIRRFVPDGIELGGGKTIAADIVVAATGIALCPLGNIRFDVDGALVRIGETWTYRGIMLSDMPNLAWSFGYIRSSWTLRSDLIARYVCRLLRAMDRRGARQCTPRLRPADRGMAARAFIDPEDFSPGYLLRGAALLPKQGAREPWTNCQDYYRERRTLANAPFDDGVLAFGNLASAHCPGEA